MLVTRNRIYILHCLTQCDSYMKQVYGELLVGFSQLIQYFIQTSENKNHDNFRILIILTILNYEKPFQDIVLERSNTKSKDVLFIRTLSLLMESLQNFFYQSSESTIQYFIDDCVDNYLIS